MSSIYLTVHLFGFMTTENEYKVYESRNHCVNSLEIHKAKFSDKERYDVTFDKANAYLKISDKQDKSIQIHQCGN